MFNFVEIMEKKILIKLPNGSIRPFGERAAKIALQALGGIEITHPDKPFEIGKGKPPPQITKPIPLKTEEKKIERPVEIKTPVKAEAKKEDIKEPVKVVKKAPAKSKGRPKATKK